MEKKGVKERRMLAQCAQEGFRIIEEHFVSNPTERFVAAPFVPQADGLSDSLEDYLYSNNPDLFYASLSLMHATPDKGLVKQLIGRKDVKADLECVLDNIERLLYQESPFERELAENILRHTGMADDEIRKEFSAKFDVAPMSMMALPTDRSVYFAKVNHGYWEYMRMAYDDTQARREQFREIDVHSKVRRLRTSGVTQCWGRQIQRHFMQRSAADGRHDSLCVSLTAGTEPPSLSIRRELNQVTRGAAIGLMSMFETVLPGLDRYALGDGGATRALIFGKTLQPFFEKYIADSEACLFVTPPHLKQIDFVNYKGRVYRFIVPPTRVNETWKTVAATLLGYLVRMGERHRSITILGQGASIASLMALLYSDIDILKGVRLRYFDLGRVLDVSVPDFLQRQAWAKKNFDEYVAEGSKVFCTTTNAECILASQP